MKVELKMWMVLALILVGKSSEASDIPQTELEVVAAFEQLVVASKRRDIEAYFELIDEEKFIGLNSDGTNFNNAGALRELVNSGVNAIERINRLDFTNVKVSVIDSNTAILVNEYEQTVTLRSGELVSFSGGGTQVWSKHSGVWKLVSISASNK